MARIDDKWAVVARQEAKEPDRAKELPASYTEVKCRKCKSIALDYGKKEEE